MAPEASQLADGSTADMTEAPEATTPEATTGDIIAKPRPKPEGGADDQIAELLEKGPLETADGDKAAPAQAAPKQAARSAEHTSELQSLMRNSYAVFGLKKTKKTI